MIETLAWSTWISRRFLPTGLSWTEGQVGLTRFIGWKRGLEHPPPNTQTHTHTNFLWSLKTPTYTYTSEKSTKRVHENNTEYKVPIMKKWINFWIASLGERHPVCDFKKNKSMDFPKFLYKWYLWKLDQTFVHLLKVNP